MQVKKGDLIFSCSRDGETQEYVLWVAEIKDVVSSFTPKGKLRDKKYICEALNFTRGGKKEYTLKEKDLNLEGYSTSPTEAVNNALRKFFSIKDMRNPEERLLTAIFGVSENSTAAAQVSMEELPKVIRELKKFYGLFERAFKIERELAEKEDRSTKKEDGKKNDSETVSTQQSDIL